MRLNFAKAIPALLATLLLTLLVFGCGSDDDKPAGKPPVSQATAARTTSGVAEDPGLTEPMVAEFGAACLVPDNSSYFANSLRRKEQWALVRDSNAIAMLLDLPTVQMALGELTRTAGWIEFQRMREQMPEVNTGLEVLEDAFSQEVFVCFDASWPEVVDAFTMLSVQMRIAFMQGSDAATVNAVVASIVDYAADVRLPGIILGFRLSDTERARKLLDEMVAKLKGAPIPITEEEIGGGKFHTLRLDASAIPARTRRNINESLSRTMVPADRIRKLNAWIDAQTIAIAVGLRDEYLLLSVGADTAQLAGLGGGSSLARSGQFAPVRRYFKPGVVSLSYECADLTTSGKIPVDFALGVLDVALGWVGELPAGLPARLRKNAAGVIEDLNAGLPEARAELTVSFLNKGVESYTFGAVLPGMDASRPLSILSSAGPVPLLAVAGRSLSSKGAYERLVHWCGVAYGYFEDYAVPRMSERDRSEFAAFEETFLPAMRQIHETTANKLIPAVDACQGLFVLSGDGELPMIPGMPAALPSPLRYPRPAMVFEINDSKLLTTAFADYRKTVNTFLAAMGKKQSDLQGRRLPPPESREFAGGMLYTYPLPIPPELNLLPHAVVTRDRALLAVAEDHSAALLRTSPLPGAGVIDLSLPAGSAVWVDLAGFTRMLFDDAEIVIHMMASEGEIDPAMADLVKGHFPVARKVLGVMKSYTSRTWVEGDTAVTHSWLRMEDAKR